MKVSLIVWFGWARHFLLFGIAGCWGTGILYYLRSIWDVTQSSFCIVLGRINLGFLEWIYLPFLPSFLLFLVPPSLFQFPASDLFIAKCNRWVLRKCISPWITENHVSYLCLLMDGVWLPLAEGLKVFVCKELCNPPEKHSCNGLITK